MNRLSWRDEPRPELGQERLDAEDRAIIERVDTYLARGLALKSWWDRGGVEKPGTERFELAFTFNRPDVSYGFFGETRVDGQKMPILGNFQTQFYDQPKSPTTDKNAAAHFLNAQLREFVLRYFMRVADFRDPQPYTADDPHPPFFLKPLSMCTGRDVRRQGFGFKQVYFKTRDGRVGRFPDAATRRIVDLRTVGTVFEWLVLDVEIFDFSFQFKPFGNDGPSLTLPLAERSLLIVTRDFVDDERDPRPGVIGHYGFGYAFIKNPLPSLLAWGPGEFDAAFQAIDFDVLADGRIRVDMVFVANRPPGILAIPANPALFGLEMADLASFGRLGEAAAPLFSLAARLPFAHVTFDPFFPALTLTNLMTGGWAARELCISREQVEKQLLMTHFERHYATIQGSLQTWRQIRNWRDEAALPAWVVSGEAA